MKLLACLLLWFAAVCPAFSEWTPAFDMDNCTRRARMIVEGTLDQKGTLKKSNTYKYYKDDNEVLDIDLDQAHLDALRATLGNDGPYEVVVFLDPPQDRPAPFPALWPLIATYPGLVAFDHEDVYLMPDDTTKGLLIKSPDYTKASFLQALGHADSFQDQAATYSFVRRKEYDVALVMAVRRGEYDLAKALLAAHADVDACANERQGMQDPGLTDLDPDRPLVTIVVEQCGASKAPNPAYDFLRILLTKGANPNLADKYDITPLMMADRVDSEEAANLLKKAGAHPFDAKDPKTQAAFVLIDAAHMNYIMIDRDCWLTQSRAPYSFDELQAQYGPQYKWSETYKVLARKAVDVLGNPYVIYRNANWHDVRINPKTIEALSAVVGPDYWEGFVPQPGDKP